MTIEEAVKQIASEAYNVDKDPFTLTAKLLLRIAYQVGLKPTDDLELP